MGGIADKIKKTVTDTKDKVVDTASKATSTTKDKIASSDIKSSQSSRDYEQAADERTKDPTQEYDEKEPLSPAKISQHEPTAVHRDPSDQKIIEPGQKPNLGSEEAREKARRSGMTKGTA